MSENSFLKRRWRLLLNIVTVLALAVLVLALRKDIVSTFENLGHVHASALLLLVPIEAWNYDAQTRLYRELFRMLGNKLSYEFLYKASLELNFINNVFPSGGVSTVSYFGIRMRSSEITAGKATVVQLLKLVLVYVSFEILLLFGVLCMALFGHVNGGIILVASSVTTLMIVGTICFVMIIGSHRRINAAYEHITGFINRVIHFLRPKHPETIKLEAGRELVEELHNNYRLIQENYRELKWALLWAGLANLTEVLAIYAVFVAFGHWINIGAVILAYAVANFAGTISVLPGGIGVYEALMTGVLAASGVPAGLTLPVVVMYRVINTIIQLPPGYYFYHRTLHASPKNAPHARA